MKLRVHFLAVIALIAGAFSPAHAASFPSLYVFGDSLVDSGNAALGTGFAEADPAKGYVGGRFSNGYNFADYLATAIGASVPTPAFIGGTNVAVGGATAQFSDPMDSNISFLEQIAYFRNFGTGVIPGNALVLVTFGGNDVRDTIATGGTIDFTTAADDFSTGLSALYAMGARNFVVTGAPDIGHLPASIAATSGNVVRLAELTDRSEEISDIIAGKAGLLDALPGTSVSYFDLFAYEQQLLADPTAFGLPANLNTTAPCWQPTAPATADCSASLYFDPIHPTTQVHRAIAGAIVAQLDSTVPEPATWIMMILGFGAIGFVLRRRRGVAFFALAARAAA